MSTSPSKALEILERKMYYHLLQEWCALDGKAFHGRDEEKKQLYQAHQDFPTINQVLSQDSTILSQATCCGAGTCRPCVATPS